MEIHSLSNNLKFSVNKKCVIFIYLLESAVHFFFPIIIVFCMTYETNLRVLSDYDCSTIVQCHVIVELIKALPYGQGRSPQIRQTG